ncbi:discoidin domain-containing protein [Pedobacter caeni]|uniref:Fibronectin type III domain-containing protein n=1 Tax=Pedobacter caeni TaxID=288992 RepID=A0A1M5A4Z3_9SPHI|nr:discoidin domain-containing protein [Pedobacter caeni]SHF25285.1 Fibronectin type III domain-containing protein [Pedobacter caeni]
MKIIYIILLVCTIMTSCTKDKETLKSPSAISDVRTEARVGGILLKWKRPADSNFLYVEVRYQKKDQVVKTLVSKHTDSLLVSGLLNKLEYTFELQVFNRDGKGIKAGEIISTNKVKPIRRIVSVVYLSDQLSQVTGITADMLETFTQQDDEGPKEDLIDGNINTYWHSAWAGDVRPLPHWVRINFPKETTIGSFKYFVRQSSHVTARPNQFAIETSADGNTWKREWTSKPNLPVDPMTTEKQQSFDKNLTSKFFRLMILANQGKLNYTHLAELRLFKMAEQETDLEKLAEDNY